MATPRRRNSLRNLRGLTAELDLSSASGAQGGRQWQHTAQLFHTRRILKDFDFFRNLDPSVQAKLPSIVHAVSEKAGTVVFRQGDPPGHCYIVLAGEVAVWGNNCGDKEADREDEDPCQNQPQNLESGVSCPESRSATKLLDPLGGTSNCLDSSGDTKPIAESPTSTRTPSSILSSLNGEDTQVECTSETKEHESQNDNAVFGTFLVSLGPGSIFGELALLEEQPRKATITCTDDCEFLIIKRADFDSILKGEIRRQRDAKLDFLKEHLPGMRELPEPKVDMVFYKFEKKSFARGHAILKQGTTSEEGIFLVCEGTVALRCKEVTNSTSPFQFRQLGVLVKGSLFGTVSSAGS